MLRADKDLNERTGALGIGLEGAEHFVTQCRGRPAPFNTRERGQNGGANDKYRGSGKHDHPSLGGVLTWITARSRTGADTGTMGRLPMLVPPLAALLYPSPLSASTPASRSRRVPPSYRG
jgi:hypothetical protein